MVIDNNWLSISYLHFGFSSILTACSTSLYIHTWWGHVRVGMIQCIMVCVYIYIYICVCVHMCSRGCMHECICLCAYICTRICMCIYIQTFTYGHTLHIIAKYNTIYITTPPPPNNTFSSQTQTISPIECIH